jgi:hypothetical protein
MEMDAPEQRGRQKNGLTAAPFENMMHQASKLRRIEDL